MTTSKIRNFAITAALTGAFICAPLSHGQTSGPKLKFRICVNQGKWESLRWDNYTIDNDAVRSMQAKIIDKLLKTGMFEILERERGSETQRRGEDALAAERDARNKEQGRTAMPLRELAIPADFIITPEIVGFNVTTRKSNNLNIGSLAQAVGLGGVVQGGNVANGSVKATAELAFRISNAETTSVLDSATGKGEVEQKNSRIDASLFGVGVNQDQFSATPVAKAIEQAIDKAVEAMTARIGKMPWKAMVAAVSQKTGRITINRGSASGIAEGMEFSIYDADDGGVDPETNIPIPGDESLIGRIKIVRVEAGFAYAEVVQGNGFKAKNIVRIK
ncbi:MAG TPA: CsgG/HfaB family protein [Fimbriimonas sp.]|nr:CsgG/HfaB family protein [Fimbriimonas sp.]